jgi:hypothetical protein
LLGAQIRECRADGEGFFDATEGYEYESLVRSPQWVGPIQKIQERAHIQTQVVHQQRRCVNGLGGLTVARASAIVAVETPG